ncbi:unnamed protein product [Rotaria sp. Silwood2]|nr:unnamed protein product [Rotaria sp. Silwood2]CAF4304468.1 unnamed protein product [Rotaria sp. Silwood2]
MEGDITGDIYYFSEPVDGSPPWVDVSPTLGCARTNFTGTPTRVTIHDLRGKENSVNIDTHGFEIMKYDGNIHNEFDSGSEMQQLYYDEISALLKKRLGASRVIIFNHIFRFRAIPHAVDQCDQNHKNPIFYAHVDNDPPAVRFKIEQVLDAEEAKTVMQKRFQLINVWRPVGPNPIINTPLTLCDYQSLDIDNDIHIAEARGSQSSVSVYAISRNAQDAHRWYYLSHMRSNELFIFKIFESDSGVAQYGAHTGFINEHESPTDSEQKSVEARCLVFYD